MAADYQAPTADYAFLFGEAFGLDIVARATGGELTAADGADVIAGAGEFAASVLAPLQSIGDREGARLVDGQVRRLTASPRRTPPSSRRDGSARRRRPPPAATGFPGRSARASARSGTPRTPRSRCAGCSRRADPRAGCRGIRQIRETYLTKLVSGQWTGTMNLTEPAAGTDLGAIRTIATPRGDGTYAIRGQKIFITWGDHDVAENIVHLVLARTPGAPEGPRGCRCSSRRSTSSTPTARSASATPSRPSPIEHKLGIHGSPTCVLSYEDATGYLVGEVGGDWPACS
jgi:hypothetical protein